jgi:hypothetical protein
MTDDLPDFLRRQTYGARRRRRSRNLAAAFSQARGPVLGRATRCSQEHDREYLRGVLSASRPTTR